MAPCRHRNAMCVRPFRISCCFFMGCFFISKCSLVYVTVLSRELFSSIGMGTWHFTQCRTSLHHYLLVLRYLSTDISTSCHGTSAPSSSPEPRHRVARTCVISQVYVDARFCVLDFATLLFEWCWVLGAGCWVLGAGCYVQTTATLSTTRATPQTTWERGPKGTSHPLIQIPLRTSAVIMHQGIKSSERVTGLSRSKNCWMTRINRTQFQI
jgi:hypothetical protein